MGSLLAQLDDCIGPDTIITDAGSVKQSVIDAARAGLTNPANFVPAHPIAGTEHSGVGSGIRYPVPRQAGYIYTG